MGGDGDVGGGARRLAKLWWWLKAPLRALDKTMDLYIRAITDCGSRLSCSSAMGCPTGQPYIPQSLRVVHSLYPARDDDHIRSLARAASPGRLMLASTDRPCKKAPRRLSVGIGRIDEDRASEFGGDVKALKAAGVPVPTEARRRRPALTNITVG